MENNKKQMSRTKKVLLSILCIILIVIITFTIYEIQTAKNTYYIGQKNLEIPIFVYHDIVEDSSEIEHDYMQTPISVFENQITGLMKLGYVPISYEDLLEYKNGKKSISKWSFLITFDDGYEGVYKYAFQIAKKYNIPITSFEVDNTVGKSGCYTWDEAKEMYDSGLVSIYLHGLQHLEYNKESTETLVSQTNQAYENLTNNLQDTSILKVFTYPYGLYTDEDIEALSQQGYIQNLTDNLVNMSDKLDLSKLHRCYPLEDSVFKIILKIQFRVIKYQNLI